MSSADPLEFRLLNARVALDGEVVGVSFTRVYAMTSRAKNYDLQLSDIRAIEVRGSGAVRAGTVWLRPEGAPPSDGPPKVNDPFALQFSDGHRPEVDRLLAEVARRAPHVVVDDMGSKHETKVAAKQERVAEIEGRCGKEITSGTFGGSKVTIFEQGFVRLGFIVGGKTVEPDRLISIEASDITQKKSGAGRAVGALASGGLNLLGSNKRGDAFLTIVTDKTTHVLKEASNDGSLKTAKKLEAAGNSVLRRTESSEPEPSSPVVSSPRTVRERLADLEGLATDGLISKDEYDDKRRALLDEL